MTGKIISKHSIVGKWCEVVYSDGFVQKTYSNGVKQRMQEWDNLGNLRSITTYQGGRLASHTEYDLDSGAVTSEMQVLNGVKRTRFYKKGILDFTLKDYPDGRMSCISHQKVKEKIKLKLLSLFQKSRT